MPEGAAEKQRRGKNTKTQSSLSSTSLITFVFLVVVNLKIAILTSVRSYLTVAVIWISLMNSEVEHLFTYQLAICVSSLEKIYIQVLCPFLIRFFILNYVSFQCILDINPLSNVSFANTFSHSVGYLFLFWGWFPLLCKSFLVWCSPICLFLHFLPLSEEKDPKLLLRPVSISVLPIFSSKSFMVSGLTVMHCWWKLNWWSQLWKTVWKSLQKLKIEQPYNTANLLLDIYLKKIKTKIWKGTYMPMFIAALLTIAEIWK